MPQHKAAGNQVTGSGRYRERAASDERHAGRHDRKDDPQITVPKHHRRFPPPARSIASYTAARVTPAISAIAVGWMP